MALPAPWASVVQSTMQASAGIEVERVPETAPAAVPETYPAIEPVPDVVPAGARLLPLVAPSQGALDGAAREAVPGPEYAPEPSEPAAEVRDRIFADRFNALWPGEDAEPGDDSPPPPAEDTLTPQARRDFLADLMEGSAPSIRSLRHRYGIGQQRATRIQSELKAALA
jgi:hypothetical protein